MRISNKTIAAFALLTLSTAASCSAEMGTDSHMTEEATVPPLPAPGPESEAAASFELNKVATISIAGATIEMSQFANRVDSPILISELFDMKRGSVLGRLTADQPLTSLEIFVNLQPDAAVPEVLAEHHAAEALELGRQDASVLNVKFDPNATIEKWTKVGCDRTWFSDEGTTPGKFVYNRKQRLENVNGERDLAVGNAPQTATFTTKDVVLGTCNDSTSSMTHQLWTVWPGETWEHGPTQTVPAGEAWGWYRIYTGRLVTDCAPGVICPPQRTTVAYFLRGNGSNYRMRTAEVTAVPQQVL